MGKFIMDEIKKDVSLKKYNLDDLPLLGELRKRYFKTKTAVCIERAKFITAYLKSTEKENEPAVLKRAKAINHYLSNRKVIFHDHNLIAGSSTSKAIGAPVYPELMGLSIWPELDTISSRKANPQSLTKKDRELLNFEIFPYWMERTVLEVTRKELNPKSLSLMEKITFFICGKSTAISHTTPYYELVLNQGLEAMIKKAKEKEETLRSGNTRTANTDAEETVAFYQAAQIAMQGILNYARRLAEKAGELARQETDPTLKKNFEIMSEICARVPSKPATSYREAINALWLCHIGILAENINMAINPGRLDQILYPYFEKDVLANKLGIEEALELTGCLWFKIADNTNLVPESAEKLFGGASSVPAVTLGGVDKKGIDAVNDLTYIMLKATELLKIEDPNVNARYYHDINDKIYRDRVCEVIINTRATPAFYNDISVINSLENQGVSLEHARDYAITGCVEIASAGREYASTSSIIFNLSAAMDLTLFNGKRPYLTGNSQIGPETGHGNDFKNFDEFWNAFETQSFHLIQQAIDLNEDLGKVHQELLPTPLLSCFFEGPFDKGKDLSRGGALYNSSGATHIGFADVCDSLNAIEYAVFQEKKLTMRQLIEAVKTNFTPPNDKLLPYLKNKAPKFGTEDPIAVKNSRKLTESLYTFYQQHTNYRGGKYRPAFWTMTNHAGLGKIGGALPSGRKAGEVFASGITPVSQKAPELTAVFKAVAGLNCLFIPGGLALNIKFTPLVHGQKYEDYLKKFGDMIESYFKIGGMQVQFNLQTYETLRDAKNYPEKYPQLTVRVSGYSAYFNDLNEAMKDELITRTQYNLFTGRAAPFPPDEEGGGK